MRIVGPCHRDDVDGASHTLPSCIADVVGTVAAPWASGSRRVS